MPISLLPSISNIFEKVLYIQLFQYSTSNNLFHANQYGFRAEYSAELVDTDLDDKQLPIAIFIDLQLQLFISYMHNRQQYVEIGYIK